MGANILFTPKPEPEEAKQPAGLSAEKSTIPKIPDVGPVNSPSLVMIGIVFAVVFGAGGMMFIMMKTGRFSNGIFPGFMIVGLLMLLMRMSGGMGGKKENLPALQKQFRRDLDGVREKANTHRAEHFRWFQTYLPEPAKLFWRVGDDLMWTATPAGPTFLRARIGVSAAAQNTHTWKTDEGEDGVDVEDVEPACLYMAANFLAAHNHIRNVPRAVHLYDSIITTVSGQREHVYPTIRSLLAQILYFTSPHLCQVKVFTDNPDGWQWLKWAPHNWDCALQSITTYTTEPEITAQAALLYTNFHHLDKSPIPFTGSGLREASHNNDVTQPAARKPITGKHTLLIVDHPDHDVYAHLPTPRSYPVDTTIIAINTSPYTGAHSYHIECSHLQIVLTYDNEKIMIDQPDRLPQSLALNLAQEMAPYRYSGELAGSLAQTSVEDMAHAPIRDIDIVRQWGLANTSTTDLDKLRNRKTPDDMIRVLVGYYRSKEQPWYLDFKNGEDGPHIIAQGNTGSGKSELLRTLFFGLCITHSPAELNFIA